MILAGAIAPQEKKCAALARRSAGDRRSHRTAASAARAAEEAEGNSGGKVDGRAKPGAASARKESEQLDSEPARFLRRRLIRRK